MLHLIQNHLFLISRISEVYIRREKKPSGLSPTVNAVLMVAVEAVGETALANEHTGRICLVVLLSVISKYCNQEIGAGS